MWTWNEYECSLLPLLLQDGRTALHIAAREGSVEAVKELVAGGCVIDVKDKVRHFRMAGLCRGEGRFGEAWRAGEIYDAGGG